MERDEMIALLRQRGIRNERLLRSMSVVDRQQFVPEPFINRAYDDSALPIGNSQTISQPYTVAFMTECLDLREGEKVLEVGTGSGYQAAVLAELAARVCTMERIPRLATRARETLEGLGYRNVWVRAANGTLGWPDEAPFDRILVAAGGPAVPPPLFEQLAEGGRMVIPVGDVANQVLQVIEKVQGTMRVTQDSGCVFVKLVGKYAWES